MKFGLFSSAQANSNDLPPGDRPGLSRLSRFQRRGRGARISVELSGRASFHRLEPGVGDLDAADGARHAHQDAAARLRGDGAALAQSGAARRAGGDARSDLRRPLRFRHRQRLPAQRVQGLSDRAGGGRGALRGGRRGDDAGVDDARALLPSRPLLAFRGHRGRAAAGAAAASAVVGGRRQRALDPPRRGARLQPDPRSIRQRRSKSPSASASTKPSARRKDLASIPMQVAVARQLYVAKDEADKQAALERQAAYTKRTVDVSRAARRRKGGSHVLAYADKAGGTEENALYGTPDEICASSKPCRTPARPMSCSPSRAASRSCAVSRATSCRPSPVPRPSPTRRNRSRAMADPLKPARRRGGRAGDPLGARRRQDARSRRPRHQARHRPRRAMGRHPRSLRAHRRHALRARGAGAVGESRHAARRDRGAGRGKQTRTRLRADGLWAAARHARPAPPPSAACWRRTSPARGASRPAPRAIISSASTPCPAAARPSSPAAAW